MSKTKLTIGATCAVSSIIAILMASDTGLRTNQRGLELIGNAESCRTQPYMCPANVLTVGIGSTTNVKPGKTYTHEEIAAMWASDMKAAEKCVNLYANGKAMNDNQFSAVSSLAFNIGCGNLQTSTLARYANRQQWGEMCGQLHRWVYANGKKLNGLVKRRADEYKLCVEAVK